MHISALSVDRNIKLDRKLWTGEGSCRKSRLKCCQCGVLFSSPFLDQRYCSIRCKDRAKYERRRNRRRDRANSGQLVFCFGENA